jgi:uncharacterized BrkB/YihY/UPF0761 family membrane protein
MIFKILLLLLLLLLLLVIISCVTFRFRWLMKKAQDWDRFEWKQSLEGVIRFTVHTSLAFRILLTYLRTELSSS